MKNLCRSMYYISFPFSFMIFILPFYARSFGASPIQIGLLYSIFALMGILMRPLVGKYIDKKGRKGAYLLGLTFYCLVQLLWMMASGYWIILIARVLQSIASAFLWISADAMVADLTKDKKYATGYGQLLQSSNRGDFIGCCIGFTLLFNFYSKNVYQIIFGVFLALSLYGLYLGLKNLEETRGEIKDLIEEDFDMTSQFKVYLTIMGLLALVNSMLSPIFLIYLKENIGAELVLLSIAYIPGEILANLLYGKIGELSDSYGKKKFMIGGLILSSILVFIIPSVKTIGLFAIINTLFALSRIMIGPAQKAIISDMTNNNHFGKSYGYYHTVVGIGAILGPIFGTYIYQYLGQDIIFFINGGLALGLTLLIGLTIKEKGKKDNKVKIAKSY